MCKPRIPIIKPSHKDPVGQGSHAHDHRRIPQSPQDPLALMASITQRGNFPSLVMRTATTADSTKHTDHLMRGYQGSTLRGAALVCLNPCQAKYSTQSRLVCDRMQPWCTKAAPNIGNSVACCAAHLSSSSDTPPRPQCKHTWSPYITSVAPPP